MSPVKKSVVVTLPPTLSAFKVTRADGSAYVSSFTISKNETRSREKLRSMVENEKQVDAANAAHMIRHWIAEGKLTLVAYDESMLTLDEGVLL